MLFKLSKEILPVFRDLYKKKCPKHIVTVCLFDHFIDRINKFPEWQNKVSFYKLDDREVKNDDPANFVFVNGSHIYFDSLTCDFLKLEKLLNQLDFKEKKVFMTIRDEFRSLIDDVIRINFLEKTFDYGAKCVYTKQSDAEIADDMKNLKITPPKGFYFDDLKEYHVDIIDLKRPQEISGWSKEYLATCIKFNPSTGLFRSSDNKLVAWLIVLETGWSGSLYVDKEYRGQHIAKNVSLAHNAKIIQAGRRLACGFVGHQNLSSFKLISKLPHFLYVNNVSLIGVKKRDYNDFAPLLA